MAVPFGMKNRHPLKKSVCPVVGIALPIHSAMYVFVASMRTIWFEVCGETEFRKAVWAAVRFVTGSARIAVICSCTGPGRSRVDGKFFDIDVGD